MINPDRPKLPPEKEAKFAEVDQRSASIYTRIEEVGARLRDIFAAMEDATPTPILINDTREMLAIVRPKDQK
jgi:hypothetical protein